MRNNRFTSIVTLIIVSAFVISTLMGCATSKAAAYEPVVPEGSRITYETVGEGNAAYSIIESTGYIPFVYVPNIGSTNPDDIQTVSAMLESFGAEENIMAAANAGIFYNWPYSTETQTTQFCYNIKEPEGIVIANGKVLKSAESIDHTDCEALVFDAAGNVGWTDYFVDADALVAGTAYYYDIHGNKVDQKDDPAQYRIVSAVTGFVPILIDGVNQYNAEDTLLNGYHNYVGHYASPAVRIVFAANEEGYAILSGRWTMNEAAEVAKERGYIFAYNLDGGGSSSLYIGADSDQDGDLDALDEFQSGYSPLQASTRTVPTYIVFTSTNKAPQSSAPSTLSVSLKSDGKYALEGFRLEDLVKDIVVEEAFVNADGEAASSTREVFSASALDPEATVVNQVYKKAEEGNMVKESTVKAGTVYYTKSTEVPVTIVYAIPGMPAPMVIETNELALCLNNNSNTRVSSNDTVGFSGDYYDYSTGYALTTKDKLTKAGEKTIKVVYEGMEASFQITLY